MKLWTKVMFAIVVSWSLMVIVIYVGSSKILKGNYKQLEREQAGINLNKANNALNALINVTNSFLLGSALWDEMYDFSVEYNDPKLEAKNKKFLDSFKPDQFQTIAPYYLDFIMLYTTSGDLNPAYAVAFNANHNAFIPIPANITNLFKQNNALRKIVFPAGSNSDVSGLMLTPKGFLIVAAHSVRQFSGLGESHGTLIYANYITDTLWKKVLSDLKLNATLYTQPDIKVNAKLEKAYENLVNRHINMVPVDPQTLLLYHLIKDMNGQPIGMLQIIMPRELNLLGNSAINYFNYALIIDGFIFSILLFYLFQLLIISRLNNVNNQITEIARTKDFSTKMSEEGSDELTYIAKEINKMLSTIKNAEEVLMDIINSMPALIILVDEKLKIFNLNAAAMHAIEVRSIGVIGQPLFRLFPYLAEYTEKFNLAINNHQLQEIDEIPHAVPEKTEYLNVVIYPLLHRKQKMLAIRIDDISDRIRLENQLEESNKLSSIGVLMNDVISAIDQPTQNISTKIDILKKNIHDGLAILTKYSEVKDNEDLKAIEELEKSADIARNFIETKQILDEIHQNAAKIAEIVKNLKNKSRMEANISMT